MSNIGELKAHLGAIKQTRQITNAMYLLSTSRMKKSMQNIDFNLTYMRRLRSTMKDIVSKAKHSDVHNKFIELDDEEKPLYIVVTSDKGLCGSYNSDIINLTLSKLKEKSGVLASIGTVGSNMLIAHGIKPDYTWYDVLQKPSLYMAGKISDTLINLYLENEVNNAYVIYTEYVSSGSHKAVCRRLLPVLRRDFADLEYEYKYIAYPIYEPSVEAVFDKMIPQYVTGFMYDVFMQSSASENSARMSAMRNATENADKMIKELSDEINAVRQLAITNEIIEIASASGVSDDEIKGDLK